MDMDSFRSGALVLVVLVVIARAAVPPKPTVTKEKFEVTLSVYSGRENPAWVFEADSANRFIQWAVPKIRKLGGHVHHEVGGSTVHHVHVKKELPAISGYRGLEIVHTERDGKSHKMVIRKCEDPILEWILITKTSGGVIKSPELLRTIRKVIRGGCKLPKSAAISKNRKTKGTQKTKTHIHKDGHAHVH